MSSGVAVEARVVCHIFHGHECRGGDGRGECLVDGKKT